MFSHSLHYHYHYYPIPFSCSSSSSISLSNNYHAKPFSGIGIWPLWGKDKGSNFDIRPLCTYKLKLCRQVIKWKEIVDDDIEEGEAFKVLKSNYKIEQLVDTIKSKLGSMEDGEISSSAYDTAWVALVPDINGSGAPQFPSTLEWIANDQLPDGSWGDPHIFLAYDRLLNTLACVIALKTWDIHPDKCQKGISFFKENISKLQDEKEMHMLSGFEVVFPSLLELARSLNIGAPYDSPILEDMYAKRELKVTRIPKEMLHNVPTTLLHSLEGMAGMDLDWEKLLKLQFGNGSFLFSPSSTAFAFMQTKDENCLGFLDSTVQKFNGGVPISYPNDIFERLWVVDRLQRLGISRYFQPEFKECIEYVYRNWTEEGVSFTKIASVNDLDDTVTGFRLLRLYGYEVSPDVFRHFKKGDEFFCYVGECTQSVSVMFNLYRASQLLFPGEKILEEARRFSYKFLTEKQAADKLSDKWIIAKDLPGEVGYALKIPWYANLPRVESRFYIEQYGGENDVWIGKTLYRMYNVNNNENLELAKLDYNNCQALHQMEWNSMQKWYMEMNLDDFGVSPRSLLLTYFIAAASIFEPERSQERLAWAKSAFLVDTIASYFDNATEHIELRKAFVQEFISTTVDARFNGRNSDTNRTIRKLIDALLRTLNHLSSDSLAAHGRGIGYAIMRVWEKWMLIWVEEGDRHKGLAELIVQTISLSSGRLSSESEKLLSHPQYHRLSNLTNSICHQLSHYQNKKVHDYGCCNTDTGHTTTQKIESDMQELVHLVLRNSSDDIDSELKQTFFTVARSFYYVAHCDLETITFHIAKVLFEKVR